MRLSVRSPGRLTEMTAESAEADLAEVTLTLGYLEDFLEAKLLIG